MSAIGAYLRGLRQGRQWDRQTLAEQTGVEAEVVRRHEEGLAVPTLAEQRAYAHAFGLGDVLAFMEGWRGRRVEVTCGERNGRVPVINCVPAGPPMDYEEYGTDSGIGYDYAERPPGLEGENLFAFVVVGESMRPDYNEGDLIYCRPVELSEELPDRSPVFVRFGAELNNTCTFKYLRDRDGEVELVPANPAYAVRRVSRSQIASLALVVHHARKPRGGFRYLADHYAQDNPMGRNPRLGRRWSDEAEDEE